MENNTQTESNNEDRLLLDLLIQKYLWVEKQLTRTLKREFGLNLTRAQILFMSHLQDGCDKASDISAKMDITRQAVSQIVKELEKLGIVQQVTSPEKKTAKRIQKTTEGEQIVKLAVSCLREVENGISSRLGHKTYRQLRSALEADWR